jgi:hypothetical protein
LGYLSRASVPSPIFGAKPIFFFLQSVVKTIRIESARKINFLFFYPFYPASACRSCCRIALAKLEQGNRRAPMDVNPATAQMYIVNPLSGGQLAGLFATHPPIRERIDRLLSRRT